MTKRILGLGQAAQKVLLGIYRAQFQGHGVAAYGGSREYNEARKRLQEKGLVTVSRARTLALLELTTAGRSAVVRVAPLHLPLLALLCALACAGCGAEFEAIEPETDPRVVYLIYGIYEAPPPDEVIDAQPRARRLAEADQGQRR